MTMEEEYGEPPEPRDYKQFPAFNRRQEKRLNQQQFGPHLPGAHENPHQMALPGMESMSHPWAEHLSRGYMLSHFKSRHEHHIQAEDVSDPDWPHTAASLDWKGSKKDLKYAEPGEGPHIPGEISMVENQAGTLRSRGLAGAMMRSAHHFNFGQETVPIHSPVRSDQGESFSNRVMPELKPDVWNNYITQEYTEAPGKPAGEAPKYPNMPKDIHPFQKAAKAKAAATHAKARAKNRRTPGQEQGRLFF